MLLRRIRREAAKSVRSARRGTRKIVKRVRRLVKKAAAKARKAGRRKSKTQKKGIVMAKSKKYKKHGKKGHMRSYSKKSGSRKRSSSRRKGGRRRKKSSGRIIVIGRRVRVRKGNIVSMNPFKVRTLLSRENLLTAGGVVAASIVTRFVANELAKRNIALPLAAQYPTAANAVYNLAIPVLGAALTRRFSPALARGMIFGGLAASISSLINAFNAPKAVAAQGRYMREYLDPVRSTGAYLAPRASMAPVAQAMGAYSGFNAWA
ncbi:hypothetical protein EBZ80_07110 [bacterium]|nr:hypothetical protein [bacterium]